MEVTLTALLDHPLADGYPWVTAGQNNRKDIGDDS